MVSFLRNESHVFNVGIKYKITLSVTALFRGLATIQLTYRVESLASAKLNDGAYYCRSLPSNHHYVALDRIVVAIFQMIPYHSIGKGRDGSAIAWRAEVSTIEV